MSLLVIGHRHCACGCGTDLDTLGKRKHARFASGAHRAQASRTARAMPKPRESAQKAHTRSQRKPRPSDVTVTYERMVARLVKEGLRHDYASRLVTEALTTRARVCKEEIGL